MRRAVFVGSAGVGKTSLLEVCLEGKDFSQKSNEYTIENNKVPSYMLVDTSSEEENWNGTYTEILLASVLVLVFDIANTQTIRDLQLITNHIKDLINVPVIVCLHKSETHIYAYDQSDLTALTSSFTDCSTIMTSNISKLGCNILRETIDTMFLTRDLDSECSPTMISKEIISENCRSSGNSSRPLTVNSSPSPRSPRERLAEKCLMQ